MLSVVYVVLSVSYDCCRLVVGRCLLLAVCMLSVVSCLLGGCFNFVLRVA